MRRGGSRTARSGFLAYAAPAGRTLVDRELHLPKAWTENRDRYTEAEVPDDVELATRPGPDPTDRAHYLCHGLACTLLRELARVAGARWAIDGVRLDLDRRSSLDQYQVRRWDGWFCHITLAMLAPRSSPSSAPPPAQRGFLNRSVS